MRYNERSFEQFKKLYYERFPESNIKLLEFDGKSKVLTKTKYGECSFYKKLLLRGVNASVVSAINKTEYFINELKEVYKDRFDYSNTEYISYNKKIKLICKIHGEFEQRSDHLLKGISCPKCGRYIRKLQLRENPCGWPYSNWENHGNKSKNFDSFKVYIIKCWNDSEEFYKIGKTFTTIKRRYQSKNEIPYNWTPYKIFIGESRKISNLERELKNFNGDNKYLPKIKFYGMYECFKKIQLSDEIISIER